MGRKYHLKLWLVGLCALLFLFAANNSLAFNNTQAVTVTPTPSAPALHGSWRHYTNGNSITSLVVQGDYLWAGSEGGVVRWNRLDGAFVKYTVADGLAGNRVSAMAVDGAGQLWVATFRGVSRFDGQSWQTYT